MEYNKLFLKELLIVLEDNLFDLDRWSVRNDDQINKEVDELKELLNKVKEITQN